MKEQSEKNTGRPTKENMEEQEGEQLLEADEASEEELYHLKTKPIPAIVMLLGGAVSSIVTYVNHYTLKNMLLIVLISLIVFYILGVILKRVFDSFHIVMKKDEEDMTEGEVIEKEKISDEEPKTTKEE